MNKKWWWIFISRKHLIGFFLMLSLGACRCDDETLSYAQVHGQDAGEDTSEQTDEGLLDVPGELQDTVPQPEDTREQDDAGPDAETLPTPAPCTVSFVHDDGQSYACDIPVNHMAGCDAMVRCACEHQALNHDADGIIDIESCVLSGTYPRGGLTVSDICAYSGQSSNQPSGLFSLLDLFEGESTGGNDITWVFGMDEMVLDEACEEVVAWTLWGGQAAWHMSLAQEGTPLPMGTDPDDFLLETPPVLGLEHLEGYENASGMLHLNIAGAERLRGLVEGSEGAWLGREFLVHGEPSDGFQWELARGKVLSEMISATHTGPVVLLEDMVAVNYEAVSFGQNYPSEGVAQFNMFFLGTLAGAGKLLDAPCISTCGCAQGRACGAEGVCEALGEGGCRSDTDCCQSRCGPEGQCEAP